MVLSCSPSRYGPLRSEPDGEQVKIGRIEGLLEKRGGIGCRQEKGAIGGGSLRLFQNYEMSFGLVCCNLK